MRSPILFIAAADFELAPLRTSLESRPSKTSHEFALCGIGPLNAAKAAATLAARAEGKQVVFVGTAGCFAPFTKPYLTRAAQVDWLTADQRLGKAYAVQGIYPTIHLPTPPAWALSLPPTRVLCSSTISTDAHLAANLRDQNCIENLELYSCAAEIAAGAASFTALLAITNAIGPGAHVAWKTNCKIAAELTAAYIVGAWSAIAD